MISNLVSSGYLSRFDLYTQPFITGIAKESLDMCQVGNICFEIIIDEVKIDNG